MSMTQRAKLQLSLASIIARSGRAPGRSLMAHASGPASESAAQYVDDSVILTLNARPINEITHISQAAPAFRRARGMI